MPGIGVPCGTTVQASLVAMPVVWLLDRIPGVKDWDASPEGIKKRFGIVGEPVILGLLLGIIIGLFAYAGTGTDYGITPILKFGYERCRDDGSSASHGFHHCRRLDTDYDVHRSVHAGTLQGS